MKRFYLIISALLLVLTSFSFTSCKSKGNSSSTTKRLGNGVSIRTEEKRIVTSEKFIDFTVVQDESDPEGSTVSLSDYVGKGKYVLVDFWASWCGPCMNEIPYISAVYNKFKGENFDVVSIACWDEPDDSLRAIEERGMVWNHIINTGTIATDLYGIAGIPQLLLFGPNGKLIAANLRGPRIEEAVTRALNKK